MLIFHNLMLLCRVKQPPPGVVADFYVRFHTFGMHLRKLSQEISDGKLDTHPVSPKFVRACKYFYGCGTN